MCEEERRVDVPGNFTQVAIVPSRHEAPKDGRGVRTGSVPADAESVTIGGLATELSMETLVDEGMVRFVEQLLKGDRGARVS
jgi:hypothetical protein